MGMFDFFLSEHQDLPQELTYQTKDLYQGLHTFKLKKNGTLWIEHIERAWVDDNGCFGGHSIEVGKPIWMKKTDVHGEVEVHTFDKEGMWVSYTLTFNKGKLKGVVKND
jgi:hypothetical protein